MKTYLFAGILGAAFATLLPRNDQILLAADDDEVPPACACPADYVSPPPSQLTGCGNGPLIVPTSPTAKEGECKVRETGCETVDKAKCVGSVNVQVTFPSSGNTCTTIWVTGGAAYPNPTQINATSQNVNLKAEAACNATGAQPGQVSFLVWKTQPAVDPQGRLLRSTNGAPVTAPDASYTFSVTCGGCARSGGDATH